MKHLVHLSIILGSLVVATACGGKSKGGSSEPEAKASCDTAGANLAASMPDMTDEAESAIAPVVAEACTGDGWSAESIDCFSSKTEQADLQACAETLSAEQQEGLWGRVGAATDADSVGDGDGDGDGMDGDGGDDDGMDEPPMEDEDDSW